VGLRKTARTQEQIVFATRTLRHVFADKLGDGEVNLYELARSRRIYRLELCPLLSDGRLLLDNSGFRVQLNNPEKLVVSLDSGDPPTLTRKQRFTLAHEIAHTLVYDIARNPPKEVEQILTVIAEAGGSAPADSVEQFCQISAGLILMPSGSLRKAIGGRRLDSPEEVVRLADTFKVSAEALIHRVAQTSTGESLRTDNHALLMVAPLEKKEEIRAVLYSPTMRCALTPPKLYGGIRYWLKRNSLPSGILGETTGNWTVRKQTGTLDIKRRPYGRRSGAWFLNIDLIQ